MLKLSLGHVALKRLENIVLRNVLYYLESDPEAFKNLVCTDAENTIPLSIEQWCCLVSDLSDLNIYLGLLPPLTLLHIVERFVLLHKLVHLLRSISK